MQVFTIGFPGKKNTVSLTYVTLLQIDHQHIFML